MEFGMLRPAFYELGNQQGQALPWCARHLLNVMQRGGTGLQSLFNQRLKDGLLVSEVAIRQSLTDRRLSGNISHRCFPALAGKGSPGSIQNLRTLPFVE